ncbi:MAG: isocitrate/isopropylmalate family dehydrogenase, partial [Candidatus Woesearchaeota archaeon]|nr:isocitrate/isopropylmalate family dehydrogenase [Candidatus Woesearchaeota archaeon]
MKSYKIALMPGDGIGPEIIREGVKVLDKTADLNNFNINWVNYDNGAEKYLKTKELITEDTLKEIKNSCKAIYLGALGDPRCKPGILEKGILLKTRFYFDQYINLRPIKLLEGVWCPLKDKTPKDIDFTVVRENTEDFYVGIGNRAKIGKSKQELEVIRSLYEVKFNLDIETQNSEIAYQIGVLSQKGSKRVIEYAFELAKKQGKTKVTAVDKANVLNNIYNFWREIVEQTSKKYPNINHEFNYVDAITMWFVKNPEWFEVVVTPNMFGDIITDLGAMIQGGL